MRTIQYDDQGVRVLQYVVNYKVRFRGLVAASRTVTLFDESDFQIVQDKVGSKEDFVFATAEQADEIFSLLGINFKNKRATAFTITKTKKFN